MLTKLSEFFIEAQSSVDELSPSTSHSSTDRCWAETICLQPDQLEAISSILQSRFLVLLPNVRDLLIDFFNVSAKASNLCNRLLVNLKLARSNSHFIHQLIDSFEKCSSSQIMESITSDILALRAPFSDLEKCNFALVHDEYITVSYRFTCAKKKVARKIRSVKIIDRFTCGLIAITFHIMTSLILASGRPGLEHFSFRLKFFCKKLLRHQMLRNGGFKIVHEQLEAAAKGSYIVKRQLETMSRLVVRLNSVLDHGKVMVRLLTERKEEKFAVVVAMDEVKKSNVRIKKQVEDVEDHLYLCIMTINKVRASVITRM